MESCGTGLRGCVAALVLCLAANAGAEEAPKSWFQQITINAFASVGYTWNFNDPLNKQNQLRAFDLDHNSIEIIGAELVVQKPVSAPNDFGFRFDLAFGELAKVAAERGLFRDPITGNSQDIDLQQAYASYIVPIGHGLRFDVGKFVTPAGAELIEGFDGYNDNFSRSLLFTWAIPFTHTGFRLSYPFNNKLSVTAMLVNGWDNMLDNNAAKSFGVSFAITPNDNWAIYLNYIGGPERDNDSTDFRHLVDAVVVWKMVPRLTLSLNADYGFDANAIQDMPMSALAMSPLDAMVSSPTKDAQWAGVALYVRWQMVKRFAVIGRGELFYDFDGFRTGTAQRLMEGTITGEFKITDAFLVRAELRGDLSDQKVFVKWDGGLRKSQPTLGINAIYVF